MDTNKNFTLQNIYGTVPCPNCRREGCRQINESQRQVCENDGKLVSVNALRRVADEMGLTRFSTSNAGYGHRYLTFTRVNNSREPWAEIGRAMLIDTGGSFEKYFPTRDEARDYMRETRKKELKDVAE